MAEPKGELKAPTTSQDTCVQADGRIESSAGELRGGDLNNKKGKVLGGLRAEHR